MRETLPPQLNSNHSSSIHPNPMVAAAAIKAAVADAVFTFIWMFCVSSLGPLSYVISSFLGLPFLFIITFLIFTRLFIFAFISHLLGAASSNPTRSLAFYAAGFAASNSLVSTALRLPAQAAGAVGGVMAIIRVMPVQYKHMLGGPYLKVDINTGVIAEGVLTFVITLAVLFIIIKGPRSMIVKNWLISILTVALVLAGSTYTGPSMNPLKAFGWAYINKNHNTWEHFVVYWISPFVGAILAAWVFRFLCPPPPPTTANTKKKKKKKKA